MIFHIKQQNTKCKKLCDLHIENMRLLKYNIYSRYKGRGIIMTINDLAQFVAPYYEKNDILHNYRHTKRLVKMVNTIIENGGYKNEVRYDNVICAAYLHAMVKHEEERALSWLMEHGVSEPQAEDIIDIAKRGQREGRPNSLESRILHDAYILEGGKSYAMTRYLIYGYKNNLGIDKTLTYIENSIVPSLRCHLPYTQEKLEEYKAFVLRNVQQMRKELEA